MSTTAHGLLGDLDLPDGTDAAAVWDAAAAALRHGLSGDDFGIPGEPALLLASVPEPLFRAWAAWHQVEPESTADGVHGFALDATTHVAVQSDLDEQFLGPDVLSLLAVDGDGAWGPRGMTVGVAEVVRPHLRPSVTHYRAA